MRHNLSYSSFLACLAFGCHGIHYQSVLMLVTATEPVRSVADFNTLEFI